MESTRESLGESDHGLRSYFVDLMASRPLSREREVLLAARIKEGDLAARNELVQANLRFVIDVAKRYRNRGLPFADLVGAGNLGLLTAAERFDGARGYKFISYAVWWIRHAICEALREHARTVRLPSNKLLLLQRISQTSRRLGQKRGSNPDLAEIAAALDLSPDQVRQTVLSTREVCSLDEAPGEHPEYTPHSRLADGRQELADAHLSRSEARRQLDQVLDGLSTREMRIIRLYFGLDGGEPQTLEQIGSQLRLTRERVRQLREQALAKLRHPARARALLAVAGDF
jgi:RNA polymerase primary sigma factor